jgi:hypothetical protein
MKPKKYPTLLMTSKTLFSLIISALPSLISHFLLLLFTVFYHGVERWEREKYTKKEHIKNKRRA